jgi:uncharacterized membrane protein YqiK
MEALFNIAALFFMLSGMVAWLFCGIVAWFFWLCRRPPTN